MKLYVNLSYLHETVSKKLRMAQKAMISERRTHHSEPLILHSDNGSPMKGDTLLETLNQLGVMPSNSRPRASNENAYAESVFKTCKYRSNFPHRGFQTIEVARKWVYYFSKWYNMEHRHSGLNFLTPKQRHDGLSVQIFERRKAVYEVAKAVHPERWSKSIRDWSLEDRVWLNPEKLQKEEKTEQATS